MQVPSFSKKNRKSPTVCHNLRSLLLLIVLVCYKPLKTFKSATVHFFCHFRSKNCPQKANFFVFPKSQRKSSKTPAHGIILAIQSVPSCVKAVTQNRKKSKHHPKIVAIGLLSFVDSLPALKIQIKTTNFRLTLKQKNVFGLKLWISPIGIYTFEIAPKHERWLIFPQLKLEAKNW